MTDIILKTCFSEVCLCVHIWNLTIFPFFLDENQIVVGSFLTGNQHEQKTKKQKMDSITIAAPTAAIPISSSAEMEDPYGQRSSATTKQNLSSPSFRGDNWSAYPIESRNKPTDINVTLPG